MRTLRYWNVVLVCSFCLAIHGFGQDEDKLPEFDSPGDLKPGDAGLLESESGMTYFLRVPKTYNKEKGARLVIFMHGSNMNGLAYLRSFEHKKWCEDDLLCCPNGEASGDDPYKGNNFGFASANPVSALTKELQKEFNTTLTYIGGHSQGGFVTYSVIMHFPDLYQGAFPMAGDCWMQNEPNLWDSKPETVAKQKRIPIAVIHGQSDPVVAYSQGEHAYGVFMAACYPKIRFFNPKNLGHQFMLSPVEEALDWLDAMNGHDPSKAMKLAKEWFKENEWGWAVQAALATKANLDADEESVSTANKILQRVEEPAKAATSEMASRIKEAEAIEWIPEWFEFHRQFSATRSAEKLVANYSKRREMQREDSEKLFWEAQKAFRAKEKDEAYKKYETILEEFPCTYHAYYAQKSISKREKEKEGKKRKFR